MTVTRSKPACLRTINSVPTAHKRYDVTVNVRNLLNARYIQSPGNLQSFNGFGAPITAIASLRVFF
ncbi:MAG: hypothetical protein AB7G68_21060 [Nitrospiraceae bacterium]